LTPTKPLPKQPLTPTDFQLNAGHPPSPDLQVRKQSFGFRKEILLFVLIVYGISWFFWLLLAASKRGLVGKMPVTPLNLLGGSGPAVAALLLSFKTIGIPGVRKLFLRLVRWRVPLQWYVVACALPPATLLLVVWFVRFITHQKTGWKLEPFGAVVIGFLFRLLILPLEELGWRGFALPRLQQNYSALASALLVGLMWSPWHLPLFLIPGARAAETNLPAILLFLVLIPFLSILMTWLFNVSRGSVLIPLIFHASYNTSVASLTAPEELQLIFSCNRRWRSCCSLLNGPFHVWLATTWRQSTARQLNSSVT
jgi:membrane protease YdiL (CAAX protease family)